jgi:HSP20 family protein
MEATMTNLTRWEPFREMAEMRRNMDQMMERFFDEPFFANFATRTPRENGAWSLPLDLAEDAESYVVKASAPGINPDDIEITLTDNVLTIKGESKEESENKESNWHVRERRYGRFMRSIALPTPIETEKVEATNEHGVLTLRLPKAQAVKPKKIAVKTTVSAN